VKSTSEVLDECAAPSVLLRQKNLNGITTKLHNNRNTNFLKKKIPRQEKKQLSIYPIEQGKSNVGFSEMDSFSWGGKGGRYILKAWFYRNTKKKWFLINFIHPTLYEYLSTTTLTKGGSAVF
jgi:hypothetical protein